MLLFLLLLHLSTTFVPNATAATVQPRPSSSLTGVVLDASGSPLQGARILVADRRTTHSWPLESEAAQESGDHPVRESFTDIEGKFRVSNLLPGSARVVVRAEQHATLRLGRVILAARDVTELGNVQLSQSATLRSSVVTGEGFAIGRARVYSLPNRNESRGFGIRTAAFETETDALGKFELSTLPLGEWTLLIEAEGRAVQRFEGVLAKNEPDRRDEPFLFQPDAEISGQVHSLPSVRDLSGLVVRAVPASELLEDETAAELAQGYVEVPVEEGGSFKISGVRPNTIYFLRAQQRKQEFKDADAWAPTQLVLSGSGKARLEWLPSARISFRALDVSTGEVAKDFTLRLHGASPGEPPLEPAAQGLQVIKNLRPTSYARPISITAGGNGYRNFESRTLELVPGQLTVAGDITLWSHPTVSIQVTDSLTHLPIHRAHVLLREEESKPPPHRSFSGLTEVNGKLSINDSPGFPRRLGVTAHGYATRVFISPFELEDGTLKVELDQGFDLTVLVENSDGDPLPGEGVKVRYGDRPNQHLFGGTDEAQDFAYTDTSGMAWFHQLGTSEYEFLLASWNENHDVIVPQQVRLEPGPVRELRFGIDPRTRIEGRVLQAGLPLTAAEVRMNGLRVRTNEQGEYRFDPVHPRTQVVDITHASRAMNYRAELRLDIPTNLIDLQLPLTTIEGIVLDANGEPVPGAALYLAGSRWQQTPELNRAYDRNLFRLAAFDRQEPVAYSDRDGLFTISGVSEALGMTLSARTPDGFVGLERVLGLRPDAQITGVRIVLQPPARLHVLPLNEQLDSGERLALVATFAGEAQGGSWMRVLAPYTGQSWDLTDLPPGKWEFTLVSLSEFGLILDTDRVQRQRIGSGQVFDLALDR